MASGVPDEIVQSPGLVSPASPTSSTGEIPLEQPPKLKGRKRLLQSLQRMSSSPSLARRTRSASTGYHRDGKASMSCVSLGSTSYAACLGNGSSSQLYPGLNVRPAASNDQRTTSPEGSARIRMVGPGSSTNVPQSMTVRLPADVRPASRGVQVENDKTEKVNENNEEEAMVQPAIEPAMQPVDKRRFDFWNDMPNELKMRIFQYLTPQEIVRCSTVSKTWHEMCFDGQLWTSVDASEYYSRIPSDSLVKILTSGGPFIRDLNLRGCIQLRDKWATEGETISAACRNLVNFSLEGCRIDKTSIHYFLLRNNRLEHVNLSGLPAVTNSAMKIIAQACPYLETLNVSWCTNVNTKGLKKVVESCTRLRDLRAGEIQGFDDEEFMLQLFETNNLERLVMHRTDVTDDSLKVLVQGVDPETDLLTGRPIVPPRKIKHLDLHHCSGLTDAGVRALAHNVPDLEGLQLSQCYELGDDSVIDIVRTTPRLTHLDLEDLDKLSNQTLLEIARSPCAECFEHLNVSYCESLGDPGMLQLLKSCPNIRTIDMDNTRISDLSLMEASSRVRRRGYGDKPSKVGMRLVVFDCANVTWAGVREVLSSNCYIPRSRKNLATVVTVTETTGRNTSTPCTTVSTAPVPQQPKTYPNEIIQLKCFYGWQMTVDEHTKRVLRGDLVSASRLDRKWADYMMVTEEAGAGGAGARRRRRRAREVERMYNADEGDGDVLGIGGFGPIVGGARRRARSGGCVVM
ncbi:F-box domain protein [Paecilomyces variotii No. 5]|uniref:F-box domain protein n=1 Tax=Byssochlamys spectabilis (strain No. 5 / NBRC 109023) TaxID=1356009 RepID=V5G714_BYSSN|nr:F-box domain protein [Paecilomyces variotii No. 5]